MLGNLVTSVALEFCLLPNGDVCYFSCKVLINSESRRGSSSVIENEWSPSFCILNLCSGNVAIVLFQFQLFKFICIFQSFLTNTFRIMGGNVV